MKKAIVSVLFGLISISSFGQISGEQIDKLAETLRTQGKSKEAIKVLVKEATDDPKLYSGLWKGLLSHAVEQDSSKWNFLNDLNIEFKTFQSADSAISSIGFSYDYNFDYASFKEKKQRRIFNSFGVNASGNVAFNKAINPNDFTEMAASYEYASFSGGVVKQTDSAVFIRLNEIEDRLAEMEDSENTDAKKLWSEFGKYLTLSSQFYYSISPKFGFESNQDFTEAQFTPGIAVNFGLKAWDKNSKLAKANFLDYPFALIRRTTGTDDSFTIYGSTIPMLQLVLDYVTPQKDKIREGLVGNLDPYPRFKIETGFRTVVFKNVDQSVFFNANLRYYQEIAPSKMIESSDMDRQFYYVMAIQTSSGVFVSYATGKLPFDAKKDKVYSIGFNSKF